MDVGRLNVFMLSVFMTIVRDLLLTFFCSTGAVRSSSWNQASGQPAPAKDSQVPLQSSLSLTPQTNKLECLRLACFFQDSLIVNFRRT